MECLHLAGISMQQKAMSSDQLPSFTLSTHTVYTYHQSDNQTHSVIIQLGNRDAKLSSKISNLIYVFEFRIEAFG